MLDTKRLTQFFILFWVIYFIAFWSRSFFLNPQGDLVAGHINLWGDWAAHFTMGTHLFNNHFQILESPFLIGARFAYPFAANLLSAFLLFLGISHTAAFIVPSLFFSCLTVVALLFFYRTLFKSSVIALLASTIFLLNGGLGVMYLAQDMLASPKPLEILLNPPHEYTRIDEENIKWISVIDSMIIPQRAFVHGFPLTLIALALTYQKLIVARKNTQAKKQVHIGWKSLVIPGLILGLMPIIHTHSFLAAAVILASWGGGELLASLKHKNIKFTFRCLKPWIQLTLMCASISVPLYALFFFAQTTGFVQFYPGWLAREYSVNWFIFWLKNWGVMPLLAGIGWWIYYSHKEKTKNEPHLFFARKISIFLPFFLLFVLLNLFLFQPFPWDNTKLLVWVSLGFSGLAAYAFYQAWNKTPNSNNRPWLAPVKRLLLIALFLFTISAGAIDAYRIQRVDLHQYVLYTAEELELADWVKTNTPREAIWLTGDKHNHWLFNLTGRQSLLTYRGWLWTHGYNYRPIERDMKMLFINPANQPLYKKYAIDYVVIGPNEKHEWDANEAAFTQQLIQIHQTKNYTIFQVPEILE